MHRDDIPRERARRICSLAGVPESPEKLVWT